MASAGPLILPRHQRRRRASFVLTSLIDVIFLLVIFFMVTSQILPFSMIPLGAMARQGTQPQTTVPPASSETPVVVRVQAGTATVAGRKVELAALPAALASLKASGIDRLMLVSARSATVQDVVTTLAAIQASGIAGVTVLDRAAQP